MLAVLFSTPRPPLGVAILGLTITMLSWMLHLLPYIMFCGMITLSVWTPSHPLPPEVIYHPVDGLPNHVHVVYTRVGSKDAMSFELNAELRFLLFLLAIPVTSVLENALFHPARRFFLRTIECWFDMRYVHPAQMTGNWPDTWTPIFSALRSCEFVADFIDGIAGRNYGPSPAHEADTYSADSLAGMDESRCSHSMAQPVDQCAPSRQYKPTSSPDPIVHSELESSTNVPRARKTFVSPPHVSSQSPWKADGLRGLSPVSKNLSRIVGTLFHHPPPRKPVIRRRINLMAKAPSPRIHPHVLKRLWSRNEDNVAPASASMSSIGTANHDSVAPWFDSAQLSRSAWGHDSNHLVAAAPELGEHIAGRSLPLSTGSHFLPGTCEALATEQTQFERQQYWGYSHSALTSPPLPAPPVHTISQDFVSGLQGEQSSQPWTMQTPLHHRSPYQGQHISPPIYELQDLGHQPLDHQSLDSVALVQQHGSHVYSDGPERPVEPREPAFGRCASLAPVSESHLPPFASLPVAPQAQFAFQLIDHAPLFQFSEDAPHLDHSPPITPPPARPETPDLARTTEEHTTTAVVVPYSTSQDESSHSASQRVPFAAPPEAVWPSCHHQSPTTITSPVLSKPCHMERPFWGLGATESFTFDVSQVTPYFDFSCHVLPPTPPHADDIELDVIPQATAAIPLPSDPQAVSGARPPISVQGVQDQQTPRDPASQSQEIASNPPPGQPSTPTEQTGSATGVTAAPDAEPSTAGNKMTVDSDDDDDDDDDESSSDSDSDMDSDSDSDSSSDDDDDDSDSDSDSDSSEEEESDAMATETVGKTSSVVPDAPSKAQDDVQGVATNKDTSTPAAPAKDDGNDSDSDSDGYFEHISTPTPPGASNDDDSSSDEDMSDHEEEYRQYWEMLYTPRHRRPPQVSVGSV